MNEIYWLSPFSYGRAPYHRYSLSETVTVKTIATIAKEMQTLHRQAVCILEEIPRKSLRAGVVFTLLVT